MSVVRQRGINSNVIISSVRHYLQYEGGFVMATVFWPKVIIAVSLGLLSLPAFFKPLHDRLQKLLPIKLLLLFFLTRLSAFCAVFVIVGTRIPTDIRGYFYPQALYRITSEIPSCLSFVRRLLQRNWQTK